MNFHVTDSSPSCIDYHKSSGSEANRMSKGNRFSFIKTLRMIQEIDRASQGVPWLTLNHMQILLHIFDMETPEGLEAQTLAKITGHNKSTVNRIVHSLGEGGGRGAASKKGLGIIEMATDPQDRRIRRIKITPYGKRLKALLLAAGGEHDEEANMMGMEMSGYMWESASNAQPVYAGVEVGEAKLTQNHALKAEVGTVKVVTQDADMGPSTLYPQGMAALERAIKYAAKNDIWHVKYRGQDVPLIHRDKAKAEVKAGRLYKANSLGMWVYHDSPVGDDYANVPKYIQADLTPDELDKFIRNVRNKIVHGGAAVALSLDEVASELNNHQRKFVVTNVLNEITGRREKAIAEAEQNIKAAEIVSANQDNLLKVGTELLKVTEAETDADKKEAMLQEAKHLGDMMTENNEFADQAMKKAREQRGLAAELTALQIKLEELQKKMGEGE